MTEIKQDSRGLYVMVEGYRARPGNVLGDHGYTTDAGPFTQGQQVRAKLLPCSKWVRLRSGSAEHHWSTSTTARNEGDADRPFSYEPGQVWEQRDGATSKVLKLVGSPRHIAQGYVVMMGDESYRGPHGEYHSLQNRPRENPKDLVRRVR